MLGLIILTRIEAHSGDEPHEHKKVPLSALDIAFLLKNKNLTVSYIPEIVCETFTLIKDIIQPEDVNVDFNEFIYYCDQGYHVVPEAIAFKGIFGALSLIKKYESALPESYLAPLCDVLLGYQKSLHKQEFVFQE